MGADKVNKDLNCDSSFQQTDLINEIEEEVNSPINNYTGPSKMFTEFSKRTFQPIHFLSTIEEHIPNQVISNDSFNEIKKIAEKFPESITSFFGFESRLSSNTRRSDYLIAVSSKKGERESLLNLIRNGDLPQNIKNKKEWKNIARFTEKWADPKSVINDKILGLWLEFDTAEGYTQTPIPSIFLQTIPLKINKSEDIKKVKWVTKNAIPTLTGNKVSKELEDKFIEAVKKLPKKASVFHVASMLSRNTEGMRLVIKRIKPDDIVPYLESIGWKDENNGLMELIEEIKSYSNCIRLHINISNKIDLKIGLECFISPDKYHRGKGWNEFFNHLVENEMCLPDNKSALLDFPGVILEDTKTSFDFESYLPSVKLPDNNFSKAIVRYISHVKISYKPGKALEAKAYTGVRLFGKQ